MDTIKVVEIRDPGHAWLRVETADLRRVDRATGVCDRISEFSRMSLRFAYLETEADAAEFVRACRSSGRFRLDHESPQEYAGGAPCRSMAFFEAEKARFDTKAMQDVQLYAPGLRGGTKVRVVGARAALDADNEGRSIVVETMDEPARRIVVSDGAFWNTLETASYGDALREASALRAQLHSAGEPSGAFCQWTKHLFEALDRCCEAVERDGRLTNRSLKSDVVEPMIAAGVSLGMSSNVSENLALGAARLFSMSYVASSAPSKDKGDFRAAASHVMVDPDRLLDVVGRVFVSEGRKLCVDVPILAAKGGVAYATRGEDGTVDVHAPFREVWFDAYRGGDPRASVLVGTADHPSGAEHALWGAMAVKLLDKRDKASFDESTKLLDGFYDDNDCARLVQAANGVNLEMEQGVALPREHDVAQGLSEDDPMSWGLFPG